VVATFVTNNPMKSRFSFPMFQAFSKRKRPWLFWLEREI